MFADCDLCRQEYYIADPCGCSDRNRTGVETGCATVFVYILLVHRTSIFNFRGGVQVVGHTGGFIWGFIILTLLCGAGSLCKNRIVAMLMGFWGLAICHCLAVCNLCFLQAAHLWRPFC